MSSEIAAAASKEGDGPPALFGLAMITVAAALFLINWRALATLRAEVDGPSEWQKALRYYLFRHVAWLGGPIVLALVGIGIVIAAGVR